MIKKDRTVLIDGLKKISTDIANLASVLEGADAQAQKTDASAEKTTAEPAEEKSPAPEQEQAKPCTYEDARAILAEKSRTGFRVEVKAILTSHNLKQLSDAKTPELYAAIIAEAEAIGNS